MSKISKWWNESDEYTYINDENDEIVSVHSNGEFIMTFVGFFIGMGILVLLGLLAGY